MTVPFDQPPLTQDDFLRVIRRVLPDDYLRSMESRPDGGFEVFQAIAKMAERVSAAIDNVEAGSFAIHARGGTLATVPLVLSRPDDSSGAFTVQAGTVVGTAQGRNFVLLANVDFDSVALEVDGAFQAVASGWEWNVRGERETAGGQTLPGLIDRFVRLNTTPAYAEPRLEVHQVADAVGGAAPMLDAVAEDRGIQRASGELDPSLALRARNLPDTVSPGAILRLLRSLLDPLGLPWDFIETFEHRYQEAYDAPSPNVGTPSYQATPPTNPNFSDDTFVYDDPREPDLHFRNRTMDRAEYRAAFVVVVSTAVTVYTSSFAFDDPGMGPDDFHTPLGKPWRATPAYDIDSSMPPGVIFGAAYDGVDVARNAAYAAVWNQLQRVRAGGVTAVMDVVRP